MCVQVYASEEAGTVTIPQNIRPEPPPNDLRAAMRLGWKSHKPKPVVRTSRRLQPVFGEPPSNEHVGIAKRGVYSGLFLPIQYRSLSRKACFRSRTVFFLNKYI